MIVVASNFGAERHPAWAYNLEAHPDATVRLGATTRTVVATRLSDAEKAALWPKITAAIPQQKCYVERTDRNIKVFRLITTSLRVGGFF